MSLYADIIIDISHENLDRTFQYEVLEEMYDFVAVGDRVIVPFGAGNREISGFILELSSTPKIDPSKIKSILRIENDDSLVEEKLLKLAYWMKTRYGSTMNHALKTVLPIKKSVKRVEEKTVVLDIPKEQAIEQCELYRKKHQVARLRLLEELIKEGAIDRKIITGKLGVSSATIKALTDVGIVRIENRRIYRNSVKHVEAEEKKLLNAAQQGIVDDFTGEYEKGIRGTYLIHGITGSGKTEVYIEMIENVVKSNRQVIVLIPEISLTYQTVMRFYKRFGDRVSTLHSKLSQGERFDQFERAKNHEIDIIIGPRSALFTPFDNLGLIVIDEEHENSYKSENMPKYHAREVAQKLAQLHGASLVLGSATPSLESYYNARIGNYKLYELKERAVSGAALPEVSIVDLREELSAGNKSIFSRRLKSAIDDRICKGEQVMLFLNRRGYAGFVSCRSCGEVIKCPHCDVSLNKHRNGKLVCHYCGYEQSDVTICPKCGSRYIGGMKAGTQSVEEQVKKIFPQAIVLRMDADTTRAKDDYEKVLSAFSNHEADILVGTQMIVKGHDFPNVTLVGILAADLSLNGNDYRAGEKTFELLVQAAGRAGRSDRPGEVIIQTYRSDHYAITSAAQQDYEAFYEEEMGYRHILMYPPKGHMLAILTESRDEALAKSFADSLAAKIRDGIMENVALIGPSSATVKKINDVFRYMIYAKSLDDAALIKVKDLAEGFTGATNNKNIRISFDFDPMVGY